MARYIGVFWNVVCEIDVMVAIAIPIIAKVLEDVPETITYRVGQKTVDFTLSLPFSWRLFYFSSVLLFLARLIYTVWCPSICKEYDSYEKFTKDGKDVGNLWPYAFEINSPLELASFWTKDGSFSGNPRDAFWRVYMKAAVTHENARAVALLLICLGILLSGIVLVQGFVTVLYAK